MKTVISLRILEFGVTFFADKQYSCNKNFFDRLFAFAFFKTHLENEQFYYPDVAWLDLHLCGIRSYRNFKDAFDFTMKNSIPAVKALED